MTNRDDNDIFVFVTAGNATKFDDVPGTTDVNTIVCRGESDLYVADITGKIRRYPGADAARRRPTLASPAAPRCSSTGCTTASTT